MPGTYLNLGNYFASDKSLVLASYLPGVFGSKFNDMSTYNQAGTLQVNPAGTTWVQSPKGPALHYATLAEIRFTNRTGFPTNVQNAFTMIAYIYDNPSNVSAYISVGSVTDTNDRLTLTSITGGTSKLAALIGAEMSSTITIPTNQWCWIGITQRSSSSRTFALWTERNYQFNNNTTAASSSVIGNNQAWTVGQSYNNSARDTTYNFTGILGAAWVWKRGFDQNQFAHLMTNMDQLVTTDFSYLMQSQIMQPTTPTPTPTSTLFMPPNFATGAGGPFFVNPLN